MVTNSEDVRSERTVKYKKQKVLYSNLPLEKSFLGSSSPYLTDKGTL
jgi:hypothetical protein